MEAAPGRGQPHAEGRAVIDAIPYLADCRACAELAARERAARQARDPSREADARVIARRHLRDAHGINAVVRS